MKILETATRRKTARKFNEKQVREEDTKYILKTVRQTPGGSNNSLSDSYKFLTYSKKSAKERHQRKENKRFTSLSEP